MNNKIYNRHEIQFLDGLISLAYVNCFCTAATCPKYYKCKDNLIEQPCKQAFINFLRQQQDLSRALYESEEE